MSLEKGPNPENKLFGKYEIDREGYVNFGDIARGELNMQSQYASRYVSGLDRPKLGEDLRIKGNPDDYHNLRIHKDDVEEFVKRVRAEREKQ